MNSMTTAARALDPDVSHAVDVPADLWRLGVDQYHAMVEAGILTTDDPVELLDGYLVAKMPKNPSHTAATYLVRKALERLVPSGWLVHAQEPVTLASSEPEPDVLVVRGEPRHYLDRHPGPRDVALVVEVADASLRKDRGLKKRLYAEAGIALYWVVNLVDRRLETYAEPSGSDYRQKQEYGPDDEVAVVVGGVEVGRVAVRDVLP
jgi:Uma2 family endonuclease